ncbi:MAG: tyrosine-type recombinase/integrase [Niabella sp.]
MFIKENYSFLLGEHNKKPVIWIQFPYNNQLKAQLKQFVKAKWSASKKCWYCIDNDYYRALFGLPLKEIGKTAILKIHPVNRAEFEKYRETLVLKAYSPNTLKTYLTEFAQLLIIIKSYPVTKLSEEKLRAYFLYCIEKLKLSELQIHSRLNAIKFYFEQVLHQKKIIADIPRPKKPSTLPKALSQKEIVKMFETVKNPKHSLMLKLCYGMGLRVSEIVNLQITDIDSSAMRVHIQRAKGKKDRVVNLPASVLQQLRIYYKTYQPKKFLFEGQYGGAISKRSVQAVFKQAMNNAGIKKPVGIHSLRHSYATHLLELGTDISLIQKLLGHNDIKTTLRYTKVSDRTIANVKSPLDHLQ